MKRGSIVCIDDSKAELGLLAEAFSRNDFNRDLVAFSDPEDAFHYIKTHISDIFVIICDIKMPVMTGPELLQKINETHDLKMLTIPFIFFSNSDNPSDVDSTYTLSAQ